VQRRTWDKTKKKDLYRVASPQTREGGKIYPGSGLHLGTGISCKQWERDLKTLTQDILLFGAGIVKFYSNMVMLGGVDRALGMEKVNVTT